MFTLFQFSFFFKYIKDRCRLSNCEQISINNKSTTSTINDKLTKQTTPPTKTTTEPTKPTTEPTKPTELQYQMRGNEEEEKKRLFKNIFPIKYFPSHTFLSSSKYLPFAFIMQKWFIV